MTDEKKIIDAIGEQIDKLLEEEEIACMIVFPKGSLIPEIKSSFENLGPDKHVMDLYLLLHAIGKTVNELCKVSPLDPEKKEDFLDGVFEMTKDGILEGDYE